jgi:hypothetical protein
VENALDIFHDEEAGPENGDMSEEVRNEGIPRILSLPFSDPAEALTGRTAYDTIWARSIEDHTPIGRIQLRNVRLKRARSRKISPVARLKDGLHVHGSERSEPGQLGTQ